MISVFPLAEIFAGLFLCMVVFLDADLENRKVVWVSTQNGENSIMHRTLPVQWEEKLHQKTFTGAPNEVDKSGNKWLEARMTKEYFLWQQGDNFGQDGGEGAINPQYYPPLIDNPSFVKTAGHKHIHHHPCSLQSLQPETFLFKNIFLFLFSVAFFSVSAWGASKIRSQKFNEIFLKITYFQLPQVLSYPFSPANQQTMFA